MSVISASQEAEIAVSRDAALQPRRQSKTVSKNNNNTIKSNWTQQKDLKQEWGVPGYAREEDS